MNAMGDAGEFMQNAVNTNNQVKAIPPPSTPPIPRAFRFIEHPTTTMDIFLNRFHSDRWHDLPSPI
jgi:hypothetical protein